MLQETAHKIALEIETRSGLPVPEFVALPLSLKGTVKDAGLSMKARTTVKDLLLVTPEGNTHGPDTVDVIERQSEIVYLGDRYEDGQDTYAHEITHTFVNTYNQFLHQLIRRLRNRLLVQLPLIEDSSNSAVVARLLWELVGIQFMYTTWQETVATFVGSTFSNALKTQEVDKLQRVMGGSLIRLNQDKKAFTTNVQSFYRTQPQEIAWDASQYLFLEKLDSVKEETAWIMGYALGAFLAQESPEIHLGALIQANPNRLLGRELVDFIFNNRTQQEYTAHFNAVLQSISRTE